MPCRCNASLICPRAFRQSLSKVIIVSYTLATTPFPKLEIYWFCHSRLCWTMTLLSVLLISFEMGLTRRPLAVRKDLSASIQINPRAKTVIYPAEASSILQVKSKDKPASFVCGFPSSPGANLQEVHRHQPLIFHDHYQQRGLWNLRLSRRWHLNLRLRRSMSAGIVLVKRTEH